MSHPWVLAITGASGAVYAVRLLQQMLLSDCKVHLVVSESGCMVLQQELGLKLDPHRLDSHALLTYRMTQPEGRWRGLNEGELAKATSNLVRHRPNDFMAPIASGSYRTSGMVVCPCSGTTLSGVVHATGKDLIQRGAEVHLKEHRKLVLVPRETPLSVFQIENMQRAATAGAVILPAMPGWYHGVESLVDLVDFVVARILDHCSIEHQLMKRWGSPTTLTGQASVEPMTGESHG